MIWGQRQLLFSGPLDLEALYPPAPPQVSSLSKSLVGCVCVSQIADGRQGPGTESRMC